MSMIQDSAFEEEVRTAQLDEAHVGDIKGAWGTINRGDTAVRKTWFARLLTLLIIMGPGLVTMIGDNDAGGIATYPTRRPVRTTAPACSGRCSS
ncbi:MAG TPA: hypothetical protein VIY29_12985 [Ktedonobacteraceae bacterium]